MKRKILLFCIIFCLPFFTTSLYAETDILGWDRAKWGMTHSQIVKIYDMGDCKDVNNVPSDMKEKYRIRPKYKLKEKVKIEHNEFEVTFFFDNCSPSGKLSGVTLLAVPAEPPFDGIVEMLIAKYGKPDSIEVHSTIGVIDRTWIRPSGSLTHHVNYKNVLVQCILYYNATRLDIDKL